MQKSCFGQRMPSSRKKAIARKLTQEWVAGYLPVNGLVREARVEMLGLDGKVQQIGADELKWICYVRDFNSGEAENPERLLRKTFAGRPRSEGVMLRLKLKDGDVIEGLAANDASLVSGDGIFLIPPDVRSNTQRIWVPRTAIEGLEVAAVIGATKRRQTPEVAADRQEKLFP
ncbi:MAG TPA: hypothetical protein VGT04_02955 [Acidobacteriaceae bacterium]|nr:hypothetical protein [Acidobacteriaceae bacterium]